ncbi:hypothetical protein [Streptomyces nodosus]|uniref:hypothetical protein n=1 Tax=Streptomyces nodosus TaxID=40318 RepID=UPI0006937905|nr:hypothetical protein [Streptomyces nodosus]MBB4794352.1 hypothetical protein [Streptomyces nodosus]
MRGVEELGIDMSGRKVERLRAKPGEGGIAVTIGDFATAKVEGTFSVASQNAQVNCFRHPAGPSGARRVSPRQKAVPFRSGEGGSGDLHDVASQSMRAHQLHRLRTRQRWINEDGHVVVDVHYPSLEAAGRDELTAYADHLLTAARGQLLSPFVPVSFPSLMGGTHDDDLRAGLLGLLDTVRGVLCSSARLRTWGHYAMTRNSLAECWRDTGPLGGDRDPVRPETCREAVDLAETLLPSTPGVTRAAVLVTDTNQLALWRTLLMGTEPTSAAPVVLRRHDRRSLRGWAQRVNMFHTEDRLDRLHELTGGWPLLVNRAHHLHGELGDPDEVLRRLADLRTDRAEARSFVEAAGVYADPLLAGGYRALDDEFKDGAFDLEGAVTAVALKIEDEDEDEARWIVNCLDALQVLDRKDTQWRLEPLLRHCVALRV